MKRWTFLIGLILLVISTTNVFSWKVDRNGLIIFSFLLLIAFFEELEEFNFLGLRGKKTDRELKDLLRKINTSDQTTNPSQELKENIPTQQEQKMQLMGVDRGNFLALVFEIERLLRYAVGIFYPNQTNDSIPPRKIVSMLREKDYLTESGAEQFHALMKVRNLIVHGRVPENEDGKLLQWTQIAYNLYKEIYEDLSGQKFS